MLQYFKHRYIMALLGIRDVIQNGRPSWILLKIQIYWKNIANIVLQTCFARVVRYDTIKNFAWPW